VDAKRRNGKLNRELRVDLHTKLITAGVIEYLLDEVRGYLLRARSRWFLKPYFCSTGLCSDLWGIVARAPTKGKLRECHSAWCAWDTGVTILKIRGCEYICAAFPAHVWH